MKTTNRIDQTFAQLKHEKRKAFIAFLTAGYPDIPTTEKLVMALAKAGADIIELGIPFSDPVADGPTIQLSSQVALEKGATLEKIFQMVERIRKTCDVPIAFMTYYNPIFCYGEEKFIQRCQKTGVDGLIVPDLPPEEAKTLIQYAKASDVATIFFMAPTTRPDRLKKVAQASTGFIYYVSLTGVTGARTALPKDIAGKIKEAKKHTTKPVCVGFGISTAEQVRMMAKHADGVIVGSAIIKAIDQYKSVDKVAAFVKKLTKALK